MHDLTNGSINQCPPVFQAASSALAFSYILSQYLAEPNTANGHQESYIFCEFRDFRPCTNTVVYVKLEVLRFYERSLGYRTLGIMGKCISRRLLRYGGFCVMSEKTGEITSP